MLNITSYISPAMVGYIVGIYSGLWALGYGIGKSVAWVRFIKNVA
jgi:hypothetical protein